jgi:Carboxypeptidase regulatory-like domain
MVLITCAGLTSGLTTARAQSTAMLQGKVVDQHGAIVAGAKITARDLGTRVERNATSEQDGLYQINNLLPGEFEIIVASAGFKTTWRHVTLHVGDKISVNFELPVGAVTERVEGIYLDFHAKEPLNGRRVSSGSDIQDLFVSN